MRYLIATLLAVALALLPVGGVAMAKSMSDAARAGACHMMPDESPAGEAGRACAEHCMMQASPPQTFGAIAQPSIANAIGVDHASLIDSRTPRAADPPDTPPPRA